MHLHAPGEARDQSQISVKAWCELQYMLVPAPGIDWQLCSRLPAEGMESIIVWWHTILAGGPQHPGCRVALFRFQKSGAAHHRAPENQSKWL